MAASVCWLKLKVNSSVWFVCPTPCHMTWWFYEVRIWERSLISPINLIWNNHNHTGYLGTHGEGYFYIKTVEKIPGKSKSSQMYSYSSYSVSRNTTHHWIKKFIFFPGSLCPIFLRLNIFKCRKEETTSTHWSSLHSAWMHQSLCVFVGAEPRVKGGAMC